MINKRYKKGLTLVELVVALIVTSIVVTAVVTLAYALDTANDFADDMSLKQAQIRFASLRVSDLIRHCKLVCYASADELAIWRADDNPKDGKINIGELTYIEAGAAHDHLWLYTFSPSSSDEISLGFIGALTTNWWSAYGSLDDPLSLIPECSKVEFGFLPKLPPNSRFVTISFDVDENGIPRHCQVNATLRGWAGNLLGEDGDIVDKDDD